MADPIPVFDGHNDALLRYIREDNYDFLQDDNAADGHLDMALAQAGHFAGGFFAVFIPNPPEHQIDARQHMTETGYHLPLPPEISAEYAHPVAMHMVARLFEVERRSEGKFKVVRTVDELEHCLQNGIMAAILHFEGAEAIDTDLHALEVFYQAGLRSLGPVWSRANAFGTGVPFSFPHSPDIGPGLTAAGKDLLQACNEMGILFDLSHLNEKGFWDVAKLSKAPLVATHSNVHVLCPSSRNLTDEQLAAIRTSDGVVGLNFSVAFLREDGKRETDTALEILVEHIDHLVDRMGVDHVAFGSDFDGANIPNKISTAAGLQNLIDVLRKTGYEDDALRKIAHQNWVRVLRKTWK